jgi:hypothetical protein
MIDALLAEPRVAAVCGSPYLKYPRRLALMNLLTRRHRNHEISAEVLARGGDIREVGIRYFPRSREEGKKIGARDWFRGLRTFSRYRNG